MKRAFRIGLFFLGGIIALPLFALLAGYLFLQTDGGKQWLAETLSRWLSTPDTSVAIAGVTGSPPFDLHVAAIDLSDRSGRWGEIRDAQLAVDGPALLRGEFAIRRLHAATVVVARMPVAGAPSQTNSSFQELHLTPPRLPVDVTLDELMIERVTLAAPVLGEPAMLTLAASGHLTSGAAALHLTLHRIDAVPGSATVALTLAGAPARLDLAAEISEPTGLLLARLLQRPDRAPLSVTLRGAGLVTDWHGTLAATAGTLLGLHADVELSAQLGYRLTLVGEAMQSGLVPPKLQPLLDDRLRFAVRAGIDGDVVSLDQFTLAGAAGEITATARLAQATQTIDGKVRVIVPDLAAASVLADRPLAGRLQVDVEIAGSVPRPDLQLNVVATGARAADVAIERLAADLHLSSEGGEHLVWSIEGGGQLAGLSQAGHPLPAGLGDVIDWSIGGKFNMAERAFVLDRVAVKDAGLDLAANGRLSPTAANGTFKLQVADLGAIGPLARLPRLRGQLTLDGDIGPDETSGISATLRGTTEDLRTGIATADALLGPRLDLKAALARDGGGNLTLSSLSATGAAVSLDGNGRMQGPDQLTGKITVHVPDAAPLGPALGTTLRGAMTLVADIAGTPSHPSLQAQLEGTGLGGAEVIARHLTAELSIADLVRPTGVLTATIDSADLPGRLDAEFTQTAPDRLSVPHLVMTAADTRLAGSIEFDLTSGHIVGKLAGNAPDLRPWSGLAGLSLAGAADLDLAFDAPDGQRADLIFNARDLVLGDGQDAMHIGRVAVSVRGNDLTGKPSGHVAVDAADIVAKTLQLTQTNLQATAASPDAIAFSGSTAGTLQVPAALPADRVAQLRIDVAGDWTPAAAAQRVTLNALTATLDADTAALQQPLHLTLGPGDYRLDDLVLALAGGRIHGNAALQGERLTTKLVGERLTLAPLGRYIGQAVTGTLDLAADLDGPLTMPAGRVTLTGRELQLGGLQQPNLPPLTLDLVVEPAGGQLSLQGRVASSTAMLATIDGRVPFSISARPFAVALPDDSPIDLTVNGDGRLEQLAELLPLGANRISGHYQVAIKINGTLSSAQTSGHVVVADGSYFNESLAGEIRDIAMDLRLASDNAANTRWRIDGNGHLAGLTQGGQPLPAELGNAIDWSIGGILDAADRSLVLEKLAANGAGLDVAASGRLSPAASQGSLRLRVAELGAFGGLVGLPQLHGHVALDADVATDAATKVVVTLHGTTDDLRTGVAAADALLGPRVDLESQAERSNDGTIALSALHVTGAAVTLEGTGTQTATGDHLVGHLALRVPDLAALGPALGTVLRGELSIAADIGGSLAHPSLQARLDGRKLGSVRVLAERAAADLRVDDLNQPSGRLVATANAADIEGRIEATIDRPAPDRWSMPKLLLTAAGTRIVGQLEYAATTSCVTGKLKGTVPNLRPWSRLAALPLAGRADLVLALGARQGQTADLTLSADGVALGDGSQTTRIGRVAVAGQVSDLTGRPSGRLSIDVRDTTIGRVQFATASLRATARSVAAISITGDATGTLSLSDQPAAQRSLPLRLDVTAEAALAGATHRITVSKFVGGLGSDSASLRQPLRVTLAPAEYRLDGIALDVAGGRVDGDAALRRDGISAKIAAKDVPLAPFGRLAGHDLTGTIDIAADLSGPTGAPRGQVKLTGRGLQFAGAQQASLPPLGVEATIVPGDRQLSVQGTVNSTDATLVTVSGTLPFAIGVQPFSVALPQNGPIGLTIDGDGRLEKLAELLPLGEDRMAGRYRLALAIKGTPAAPQASGNFTIDDGSYVNQAFGTKLNSIGAELVGDGGKLRLSRFTARDGQAGQFAATGGIDLGASPSPTLDFQGKLTHFLIADSDDANATADAEIRVEGTVGTPKLFARIHVPRGDFRIPDRLPPTVVTLNVIEIDSRLPDIAAQKAAQIRQREASKPAPALPVALDVQVDIPGQTFVRGHGLDSEWRGKMTIDGNSTAPHVAGGLEAVRGTVNLLGRNFVLRRGTITFPTGEIDAPRIDLLAEYSANDIRAQVHLEGSPTAPRLQLSSTPQLPQDEILSRVLFGRDTGGITPAEGVQLAVAARSLARGGPGLLDRLRTSLGLDRLSIGTSSADSQNAGLSQSSVAGVSPAQSSAASGSQTSTSPAISGGKYVAPGVFVGVEQGSTPQSTRAKVEVEITHNITGYSSVGANSSSQVGVDWRYDY